MRAAYVFGVRFRLEPATGRVDPATFETVYRKPAADPGEQGWLFFRDALWRGEAGDDAHVRRLAEGWLDVPVVSAEFKQLETDDAYLDALKAEVETNLDAFNAESVTETLHKYLGSSIQVQ
jgi:hypothetical protein